MIVSTDAVVLHGRKFGDTSRIVTLYTAEMGRLTVVAKGVRTPKSPFGSALEPLSIIRATVYVKAGRDLHTVSAAEPLLRLSTLQSSYDHLTAGLLVAELFMRTQTDGQKDGMAWDVLQSGIVDLNTSTAPYATSVRLRLSLADVMGFGLPECPLPTTSVVSIDPTDGLARPDPAPGIRMSATAFMRMTHAVLHPGELLPDVDFSASDRLEIESFLAAYFSWHLDRRLTLRSPDVLR